MIGLPRGQARNLVLLGIASIHAGCATPTVVRKSAKDLDTMDQRSHQAKQLFHQGKYDDAETILTDLSRERTVSQPLYQCELGTLYLAKGDTEKAFQNFRAAQVSAESFFDEKSERKAASLWGSEGAKVYKGEPYERSSLYLILGLLFLDMGQVDNALASFKNGLLSDADVANEQYKSDFALLQFLAAHCYALRNEPAMREQYMKIAFKSATQCHPDAQAAVTALYDVENLPKGQGLAPIVAFLQRAYGHAASELTTKEKIVAFVEKKIASVDNPDYYRALTGDFNTLAVVWAGTGVNVQRRGKHGETRVIHPGTLPISDYGLWGDAGRHQPIRGVGSLGRQATTRGARLMDNVLGQQAAFKGATHDLGESLIDVAGDVSNPQAAAVLLVVGLVAHGVSAATTAKADVRCWKTLPHEFQVVPMQLEPGEHEMTLCAYKYVTPLNSRLIRFAVTDGKPVNVVHIFADVFGSESVPRRFRLSQQQWRAITMAEMGYRVVDVNGDGELSASEMSLAASRYLTMYDSNKNGTLEPLENNAASAAASSAFQSGMVKP